MNIVVGLFVQAGTTSHVMFSLNLQKMGSSKGL